MSELSEAINEMRTMRESYDQLGAAAEAYNTGKTELAANITAKGVEASASETLPELAEKVSAITQESYTINGGEMYAKQLFGSLTTPNYWNLYEVLANLLSDGRLVEYGGILLAEYYKGYDSIALSGAGAGGAYVVSDKDSQGNFIMYTSDTTHTWNDDLNGKGNRWVAYCFADEWHDFEITDTNTSPRSIFIGRKVGTISCLVNTRISQIVVNDGNELKDFVGGSFAHEWNKRLVTRLNERGSGVCLSNLSKLESVYLQVGNIIDGNFVFSGNATGAVPSIIVKTCEEIICQTRGGIFFMIANWADTTPPAIFHVKGLKKCAGLSLFAGNNYGTPSVLGVFIAEDLEELYGSGGYGNTCALQLNAQKKAYFPVLEKVDRYYNNVNYKAPFQYLNHLTYMYFGYKDNDKSKVISLTGSSKCPTLTDVELKNGYCKSIEIGMLTDALTEANMYAHILQRLKQDEADCGDGVTITLGSTNLAKLTSAESVALLDSLTNTYGYTFA